MRKPRAVIPGFSVVAHDVDDDGGAVVVRRLGNAAVAVDLGRGGYELLELNSAFLLMLDTRLEPLYIGELPAVSMIF